MKPVERLKSYSLKVAAGAGITPAMLGRINVFALKPLTEEDLYVRKFLICHNLVDRDRERFPEVLLEDFTRTLPGKSLLIGHDRKGPGIGLFLMRRLRRCPRIPSQP